MLPRHTHLAQKPEWRDLNADSCMASTRLFWQSTWSLNIQFHVHSPNEKSWRYHVSPEMQFKSVQMKKGYSTFASILPYIIKSVDQCHTASPSAGLHYSCLSIYQSSPHSWRSSHSTNPLSVCLAPTPLRGSKAQHVGWNMDTPRNLGCTGSLWLKSGHFNSFFQLPITMGEITYQGRSTDLSQKYPSPFDR